MKPHAPISSLPTHDVMNVPPHQGAQDFWTSDPALQDHVAANQASWAGRHLAAAGKAFGSENNQERAEQANRVPPVLRAFDRYGMRVNQAEFHPAYHDLMGLAMQHGLHSFAWTHAKPGGHVANGALTYMFGQLEAGVLCPMAMTYAVIPSLRATPEIAETWMPRVLASDYDRRDMPAEQKTAATMGMFMTEKQGGSDVQANSTRAVPAGAQSGEGADYLLTGHKWFCSAPMCDAFLVLAQAEGGLSCFLVPRWRPDGSRNNLLIQRLKDKLGNRSNASSEMEFHDTYAQMLGAEGRGVRTIIDMVVGNRIYCATGSSALMRQALVQALHHTSHRSAFQKRLIQQPLMRTVLTDLALETEAAIALSLRVALAMDLAENDPAEAALSRLGTAIAKYWVCKRTPAVVGEALECHGGAGYVEESPMPRLYREAPLNSIWEGSGNVVCLDVLRTLSRELEAFTAWLAEVQPFARQDRRIGSALEGLQQNLAHKEGLEGRMRQVTEQMALIWQACLLMKTSPQPVADAFIAARLSGGFAGAFGNLPAGVNCDAILERASGG